MSYDFENFGNHLGHSLSSIAFRAFTTPRQDLTLCLHIRSLPTNLTNYHHISTHCTCRAHAYEFNGCGLIDVRKARFMRSSILTRSLQSRHHQHHHNHLPRRHARRPSLLPLLLARHLQWHRRPDPKCHRLLPLRRERIRWLDRRRFHLVCLV